MTVYKSFLLREVFKVVCQQNELSLLFFFCAYASFTEVVKRPPSVVKTLSLFFILSYLTS